MRRDTSFAYRVPSPVDGREYPLEFARYGDPSCATTEIPLGKPGPVVRLQIALAEKYSYGRIAEHRKALDDHMVTPAPAVEYARLFEADTLVMLRYKTMAKRL